MQSPFDVTTFGIGGQRESSSRSAELLDLSAQPIEGRLLVGRRQVGSVPAGATVAGVDLAGGQAVVVEPTPTGARLRRIAL